MEDVRTSLAAVGLEQFSGRFEEAGYDDVAFLRANCVMMLPGLIQDVVRAIENMTATRAC